MRYIRLVLSGLILLSTTCLYAIGDSNKWESTTYDTTAVRMDKRIVGSFSVGTATPTASLNVVLLATGTARVKQIDWADGSISTSAVGGILGTLNHNALNNLAVGDVHTQYFRKYSDNVSTRTWKYESNNGAVPTAMAQVWFGTCTNITNQNSVATTGYNLITLPHFFPHIYIGAGTTSTDGVLGKQDPYIYMDTANRYTDIEGDIYMFNNLKFMNHSSIVAGGISTPTFLQMAGNVNLYGYDVIGTNFAITTNAGDGVSIRNASDTRYAGVYLSSITFSSDNSVLSSTANLLNQVTQLQGDVTGAYNTTVVGNDSHSHGLQTLASTVVNSTTAFGGHVTGNIGATVVGNNTHLHDLTTVSVSTMATGFVSKTGDTMTGMLTENNNIVVYGSSTLHGDVYIATGAIKTSTGKVGLATGANTVVNSSVVILKESIYSGNNAGLTIGRASITPGAASDMGNIYLFGSDDMSINNGGTISFGADYETGATGDTRMSAIFGGKENASNSNYSGYLGFYTRLSGNLPAERARITSTGNLGLGTNSPLRRLDVNEASGNCLRLIYNDSDGSAASYADFLMSISGDLSITPVGKVNITKAAGTAGALIQVSTGTTTHFEVTGTSTTVNSSSFYVNSYGIYLSTGGVALSPNTTTPSDTGILKLFYVNGIATMYLSTATTQGGWATQ